MHLLSSRALASRSLVPASATLIIAAAFFAACSSSSSPAASDGGSSSGGDGGACQVYEPPTGFDAEAPTVSFSKDVMPIFTASCAFPSCHGSTQVPAGGMYLGANAGTTYANLVNTAALDYPQMDRVKPGDPASSYLLHRIDNDACTLPGCTTVACAELMPQGNSTTLPQDNLLTIRGWIAQGAINDSPAAEGGAEDAGGSGGGADASGD
jgi:hypothetical protein